MILPACLEHLALAIVNLRGYVWDWEVFNNVVSNIYFLIHETKTNQKHHVRVFKKHTSSKTWLNICIHLRIRFINHRENFFFKYYLSSAGCLYLCMYLSIYVIAIVATPFNLQLWNFGTTLLTGLPKNGFLKFLKICFFAELSPFFYISLRFLCNFEEQLRKNQWR